MKMRILLLALAAVVASAMLPAVVQAESDTFVMYVTPYLVYGVDIDTTAMNFGNMTPTQIKISTGPLDQSMNVPSSATVRNSGSVTEDLQILCEAPAGGLSLSTDLSPGLNEMAFAVILSSDDASAKDIDASDYVDADCIATAASDMGGEAASHPKSLGVGANGDDIPSGTRRIMWFYVEMGSDLSVSTAQELTVTVQTAATSTF